MPDDLCDKDFSAFPHYETLDKQHGCLDRRRYWIKDLSDPEWDSYAGLCGRQ